MIPKLRVHIVSETAWLLQGQGVHTAFMDHVQLMQEEQDVVTLVNQEGWGDVLHAHTYGPYFFWKGRHYPGRKIFTAHVIPDSVTGSLPQGRLWMPWVRRYLRRVYAYADVCVAISPRVEDAIRELGVSTPIVSIGNPIHKEKFAVSLERRTRARQRWRLPDEAFVVLGVGQLEGRKGVETFLDVAEACPAYVFLWAGGRPFGPLTEGIARIRRRQKQLGARVRWTGLLSLEHMPEVYAAADVLLFPSHQENCPLAPLEAAASGLPVIFRDLPEYRRLYTAPYLRAGTCEEFIEQLQRLSSDAVARQQGQALSAALVGQFDKQHIRSKLMELYREVAQGRYA
jgi:1,2-diacylglycerol-3-alpha-glucose alpha-1,2-galactosyltransferase